MTQCGLTIRHFLYLNKTTRHSLTQHNVMKCDTQQETHNHTIPDKGPNLQVQLGYINNCI